MKKLIFSLALLLATSLVIAQQTLTLSGTIAKPEGDKVMLMIPNPLFPTLEGHNAIATLEEDNSFSLPVKLEQPVFATFRHGREYTTLYLEPGKDVALSLNAEEFDESLVYEGAGSAANNFMIAYFLEFMDGNQLQEQMKSLDAAAFRQYADKRKKEKQTFLEEQSADIPAEFYKSMAAKIDYEWGMELVNYPSMHAYLNEGEKPELPENYESFGKELAVDREDLIPLEEYRQYMYRRVSNLYNEQAMAMESMPEGTAYIKGRYDFAAEHLSGKVLDFYRHKMLYEGMKYAGPDSFEEAYKRFAATTDVQEYRESLDEAYNAMAHLKRGNMAPALTLAKLEGGKMTMEELKGKVVYIDFWASWCGPCIGEMPSAKKVKEHFKDQSEVAFVYISIDDDENSWRKMIEKQEIEGIHLFSQGWQSEAPQAYAIQGIPRYVLLDREGKIIDANMSRPSDPATIKRIEEALAAN